jgi:RP/EB family microtubule-associated protein
MINSGYFTSRNEILEWLSTLLGLEVTRIEQLGSGSLYCQVLDAAYPHKVPLQKVKWGAQLEVDFLHNFRILQTACERVGIGRAIEVTVGRGRRRNWPRPSTRTIWN